MGSINSCVFLFVHHVISVDNLSLININSYDILRLI